MDVIIKESQRVNSYFKAWKEYNIDLLRHIFTPNAKYVIRGKRTYYGIDQIVEYWKKNQKRQKELQLYWKIKKSTPRCEIVKFGAYFFDITTGLYNKINGEIIFKFDEKNRILVLTEAYTKRTNFKRYYEEKSVNKIL